VFDVLDRERIAPYLVSAADSGVSMAVSPGWTNSLTDELARFGTLSIIPDIALVTMVGENLKTVPDMHTVFRLLDGLKIELIAHGALPIALSFALSENDLEDAVGRLHQFFFSELDPDIFE
jgi:aspartokinase